MIRYGDLQLIQNSEGYLVIACDSSGGIGNKRLDTVQISPELAGYYAACVPLMEVLAARGTVLSMVDTLSVEMEPTGKRIIDGIKTAMQQLKIDVNLLTGSTEDNILTETTGIGVTVIGQIPNKHQLQKCIFEDQWLVLLGVPKVGAEFLAEEIEDNYGETMTLEGLKQLADCNLIRDMIPVGSKGIAYEAEVLATRYQLSVKLVETEFKQKGIDFKKSAGPATCLLVAIEEIDFTELINYVGSKVGKSLPIHCIGRFYRE